MKQITREWLAFLREQYPVGSRIRLNSMEDPYPIAITGIMIVLETECCRSACRTLTLTARTTNGSNDLRLPSHPQ